MAKMIETENADTGYSLLSPKQVAVFAEAVCRKGDCKTTCNAFR
jgi:hypothetical protein